MNLIDERNHRGTNDTDECLARPGRLTVAELAAALPGRVERVRPTAAYRWALWMGVAAMVAISAVYAALVVLSGWALFRVAEDWVTWVRSGTGGALAAGFRTGLFLAGLGLGILVLGSLLRPFVLKSRGRVQALAVNPASEPLLFAFIHMVCDAVGVSRPARVEVDCRLNASVRFRGGGWRMASDDWVLTLGLPMVAGLSLTAFAGVLAHELGHFGQGWAMRACYWIRSLNEWLERAAGRENADGVLDRWAGASGTDVHQGMLMLIRIGVGFSEMVLGVLVFLGRLVNRRLLRQMEWNADRVQIQLVGSAEFEATFRRLCVLSEARREVYRPRRRSEGKASGMPVDLPRAVVRAADAVPDETIDRWCERRLARVDEFMEAHPSDASRLEQARSMAAPGMFRHGGEATELFSCFETLSRQVTALHYRDDLGLRDGS